MIILTLIFIQQIPKQDFFGARHNSYSLWVLFVITMSMYNQCTMCSSLV